MPALRQAAHTLDVPKTGRLRLGVVADTHSRPHAATLELLAARAPDVILHGGDIGDLAVLDALATVAPVVAVRGNVDGRGDGLPDDMVVTLRDSQGPLITLLLTHIAISRGRLRADVGRRAAAAGAQIVVCGHSHVPVIARDRGFGVFNPGSCGPRRFALPIVFGVMDVAPTGVDFMHVSCETGERWLPQPV